MNETDLMKLCDYLECNDASMEAQCEAAAELHRQHRLLRALASDMEILRSVNAQLLTAVEWLLSATVTMRMEYSEADAAADNARETVARVKNNA